VKTPPGAVFVFPAPGTAFVFAPEGQAWKRLPHTRQRKTPSIVLSAVTASRRKGDRRKFSLFNENKHEKSKKISEVNKYTAYTNIRRRGVKSLQTLYKIFYMEYNGHCNKGGECFERNRGRLRGAGGRIYRSLDETQNMEKERKVKKL
jgi:hypothetical protein